MNKIKLYLLIFFVFFACLPVNTVYATSNTSGYAWSNNIGWINFGCTNCNVQVSNGAITGYAWSEDYGWINLEPTNSGVDNTTSGDLSGSAWGENSGWIDFGAATINPTGQFIGTATGDIVGTITFTCSATGCPVTTNWRPSSGNGGDGGDGGNGTVTCSSNSACGTDGLIEPSFCSNGNVYKNYVVHTCSSPGTVDSSCSSSTTPQLQTTCSASQTCNNGSCTNQTFACSSNSTCGTDGYIGGLFCSNGNVSKNYTVYTCSAPGTISSSCSSSTTPQLQTTCSPSQTCNNGSCEDQQIIIQQHNECSSQKQCVSVSGAGSDQCQTNNDCGNIVAGGGNHTECNEQKQCIFVNSAGSNQCQVDSDCNSIFTPIATESVKTIENIVNVVEEIIPEPIKAVVEETKKIIETPQGSAVTKTVSTTGLVVATAVTASSLFSLSFFELFLIPLRLLGLLLTALGIKKRIVPWGVVYDSITKRPLDPAYVVLKNTQGEVVATAVTDLDGRYGFLVGPGIYQISANKTNYDFPSKKLSGRMADELHTDLYFGESIEVKTQGGVITKNIPLDPVKFDWNEFAKKNKKLMKFYSKWDVILRRVYDIIFIIGFIIAVVAYVFAPYPYNIAIMILYLIFLLFRQLGFKPKSYGHIVDKMTGVPLSFAIIRVMNPQFNVEIASKSADKYGKYYCLVPPGKCYIKIEKKNEDGSYSLVHTSTIIDVSKKGIIKERFKV